MSLDAAVPIVPVVILGSSRVLRRKLLQLNFGREVRVIFCKAISPNDYSKETITAFMSEVRTQMKQVIDNNYSWLKPLTVQKNEN